jgi:TolB-like protein
MDMKQRNRVLPCAVILALVLLAPAWAQQAAWYTGSGGEGLSIAVLVPEAKDIGAGQAYLPTMAQGVLVGDFTKFSKMRVIDRQALDKVIAEGESGYYAEESGFVRLGKAADVQYVLSGALQKTGAGFLLQFKVTEAATGASKAAYNGNCTQAELENFSALKKASEDLLGQLGVSLTDAGRNTLRGTNEQNIRAETALAKGITAQRGGTVVEALSYYYEAAKFDPSLAEAASRSSVLTADIQAGNIGQNVRTDIQQRSAWLKVLREAAAFYREHLPYEVVYDPALIQGKTDYNKETVEISFKTAIIFQESAWRILSELKQGLEKTGKSSNWGLASWPDSTEAAVFESYTSWNINAVLINEDGKTIGSVKWTPGSQVRLRNRDACVLARETVTFRDVNANEISDTLTVTITSVNGMDAKTAGERGYIGIYSDDTLSLIEDFSVSYDLRYEGIGIAGYRGSYNPVLPSRILQRPVTYIVNEAFAGNKLTSVVIPGSVTSIGERAFNSNALTSVVIPGSVTSIGNEAFYLNKLTSVVISKGVTKIGDRAFIGDYNSNALTSVVIPDSVTSIGNEAFAKNRLTSVVIPNGVISIGERAFNSNALTSVVIPGSVTSIGNEAFAKNRLTSVVIPNGVTSIGEGAFNSNALTSVVIPGSVTSIGEGAFSHNKLTSVVIPGSVTSIGKGAFYENALTSITIGNNVLITGNYDFEGFYNNNGKKAGTYTRSGRDTWSYQPRR